MKVFWRPSWLCFKKLSERKGRRLWIGILLVLKSEFSEYVCVNWMIPYGAGVTLRNVSLSWSKKLYCWLISVISFCPIPVVFSNDSANCVVLIGFFFQTIRSYFLFRNIIKYSLEDVPLSIYRTKLGIGVSRMVLGEYCTDLMEFLVGRVFSAISEM